MWLQHEAEAMSMMPILEQGGCGHSTAWGRCLQCQEGEGQIQLKRGMGTMFMTPRGRPGRRDYSVVQGRHLQHQEGDWMNASAVMNEGDVYNNDSEAGQMWPQSGV